MENGQGRTPSQHQQVVKGEQRVESENLFFLPVLLFNKSIQEGKALWSQSPQKLKQYVFPNPPFIHTCILYKLLTSTISRIMEVLCTLFRLFLLLLYENWKEKGQEQSG